MIAIFDNDTAGAAALETLADVELPPNIKVLALPRSEVAENYPTQGPQGVADLNVNGLACSIELYLGPALLKGDGGRHPVRWTGWNAKLTRYQGAVERKDEIEATFLALLAECSSPAAARTRFPDLATAVDTIMFAFATGRDGSLDETAAITSREAGVAPDRSRGSREYRSTCRRTARPPPP